MESHQYAWADNFESAVGMLGPDNPFVGFDLNITSQEREVLESLQSNQTSIYELKTLEGNLDSFQHTYTQYLVSIGNNPYISSSAAAIITKLINSFGIKDIHYYGSSNDESPALLWHIDQYALIYEKPVYRIAITLKGPGTLFCKPSEQVNEKSLFIEKFKEVSDMFMYSLESQSFNTDIFSLQNKLCSFENGHKIYQAETLSATIFTVGGKIDNISPLSAVHTSPKNQAERIFLSLDDRSLFGEAL
jgi:hypothetical protein